jgi:hypothetical protein
LTTHWRERSLTVLVVLECIQLFVIAPLAAEHGVSLALFLTIVVANIAVALAVVWHLRAAVTAVLTASGMEAVAFALRISHPTQQMESLDIAAAFVLLVTLTVVLSVVVFGSGRVTIHRVVGAVAIYLNIATTFALAYRLIDALGPGRFSSSPTIAGHAHTVSDLIYFSFTTLTTTGFGDIVPIDPFARSLSNMESVIGQLFPATLLARLISLEIEHRREDTP